jgi:hypothetical protein
MFDDHIHLVDMNTASTQHTRHFGIDLGDNQARGLDGG